MSNRQIVVNISISKQPSKSPMRKTIRRVLPRDEQKYQHDWHAKNRKRQPTFEEDRYVPADRLLGNQAMVQLLSVKLETEGEGATTDFLESLGCPDVGTVLKAIARL
jgi:hypothetical protein